jgi:hypothetical protein
MQKSAKSATSTVSVKININGIGLTDELLEGAFSFVFICLIIRSAQSIIPEVGEPLFFILRLNTRLFS